MNLYSLLQPSAANGKPVRVVRAVARGEVLCWDDVAIDVADPMMRLQREMEMSL